MYAIHCQYVLCPPMVGPHASVTHATRPPSLGSAVASSAVMIAMGTLYTMGVMKSPKKTIEGGAQYNSAFIDQFNMNNGANLISIDSSGGPEECNHQQRKYADIAI